MQVKQGKMQGIYNIGSYYYDDFANKKNGEFDVALQCKDGYDIIEVKFYKDKIKKSLIENEIQQIKKINEISVERIGFASINGFEENINNISYMINGDDIYKIN